MTTAAVTARRSPPIAARPSPPIAALYRLGYAVKEKTTAMDKSRLEAGLCRRICFSSTVYVAGVRNVADRLEAGLIMECHKTTEHTAYPIFYDVEPTEVRKQSGAVGEAFAKHEKEEAAGKWREALKDAGDLAGWELKSTADG
ncbi:hypothetical protein L1887_39222 [Cichorium endivia]|nr:hypothetical protein L1887_39222 [Cichorium endivia]